MAAFIIQEEEGERAFRRERIFRDRVHPLEAYREEELVKKYCFLREGIVHIMGLLGEDALNHPTAPWSPPQTKRSSQWDRCWTSKRIFWTKDPRDHWRSIWSANRKRICWTKKPPCESSNIVQRSTWRWAGTAHLKLLAWCQEWNMDRWQIHWPGNCKSQTETNSRIQIEVMWCADHRRRKNCGCSA